MKSMIKQLELIQRMDQLIRLQATGTPIELADKMDISKTKLYAVLNTMKALNAPVVYDMSLQSFLYEEEVKFIAGFHSYARKNRASNARVG